MDDLFALLTDALSGGMAIACAASLGWGVLSILLSPCHLSSIPLVVGFLTARGERSTARGFLLSALFAAGTIIMIALIGTVTAALGQILGDIGTAGRYAVAGALVIVGLVLMDVIRPPDTGVVLRPLRIRSAGISALVLGLLFGIALGPCTFAFLAPVLGVVFELSGTDPWSGAALLGSFAAGHAGIIVVAGGIAAHVQAYLNWSNRSRVIVWIKRISGLLVILGALYSVWAF